jgi:hypothetical protein
VSQWRGQGRDLTNWLSKSQRGRSDPQIDQGA